MRHWSQGQYPCLFKFCRKADHNPPLAHNPQSRSVQFIFRSCQKSKCQVWKKSVSIVQSTFLDHGSSKQFVRNCTCSHIPGAKGAFIFWLAIFLLLDQMFIQIRVMNSYVLWDAFCIAKNEGMHELEWLNWMKIRNSILICRYIYWRRFIQ